MAFLVVLACSCADRANLGGIGTSTGTSGRNTPSLALGDGGTTAIGPHPSPIPSDFRTSMTKIGAARFVSVGHAGGRWEADVYADANALAALHVDRGAVAVGTRFVEEHFERGDAGAGPLFMMEKRPPGFDREHGDWRYVAVGARGEVAGDGVIEGCAGCHGDAPHDHVFRVSGDTK